MIKAVLADWGHTLFDTPGSVDFIERWAADHGRTTPRHRIEQLYSDALNRSRTPEEMSKGRDKSAMVHRQCWHGLYADLERELPGLSDPLYMFETGPQGWWPFVDTADFLEQLAARGIPLVVVSDVPFDIRPIFDHHGLRHLVHAFVLSGEHGTIKAEGRLFRIALEAAGVEARDAVMVGDNPVNDGHAVHQGIRTVLLPMVPSGQPRGFETVLKLIA